MIANIDKIFMIHCENDIDRLHFQNVQFAKHNLDYSIIDCVKVNTSNGFSNQSIKSCFLSHMKAIETSISTQKNCLILEDDVLLTTNTNNISKNIFQIMNNESWDMIYLYPPYWGNKLIIQKKSTYSKVKGILNGHAYIINIKSVGKIYDMLTKHYDALEKKVDKKYRLASHIDRVYAHYIHKKLNVFATNVHHFIQNKKQFGSSLDWGWNGDTTWL